MAKKRFHDEYKRDTVHEAGRSYKGDMPGKQLIYEDRNAPCLLPMHVISKDWPHEPASNIGMIGGDLFEGVQKQLHKDQSDFGKIRNPKKY